MTTVGIDFDQVIMIPGAKPSVTAEEDLAVWLRLEGPALDRKVRALRAQASQIEGLVRSVGLEAYTRQVADEFYVEPDRASGGPPGA